MSLVAGSGFLFMTVALEGLSFTRLAWTRTMVGAVVLVTAASLARQVHLPRRRALWGHVIVLSVVNLVIPYILLAWSQQYVASSVAVVLNATTPILTAVIAGLVLRSERVTQQRVVGLLIGLAGVVLIVAPWQRQDGTSVLWGSAACLVAALCFAVSFAYARRFVPAHELPGLSLSGLIAGCAGVVMLALSPVMLRGRFDLDVSVVLSGVVLGLLNSGLAVLWTLNIVRAWGPSRAATPLYLAPVVGMVLGFVVLHEAISARQVTGAAITMAAVAFVGGGGPSPCGRQGTVPD